MRVFSFAVESTRYCNYSSNKFGEELTYIKPWWIKDVDVNYFNCITKDNCSRYSAINTEDATIGSFLYLAQLEESEKGYLSLLKDGLKPEEARGILPLDTKCDMIMTGFESDWQHFFNLRALGTTGKPHPQAKELAEPLMKEFSLKGYNIKSN